MRAEPIHWHHDGELQRAEPDDSGSAATSRRFPVAVVVGAGGAIGAALIERLLRSGVSDHVFALSRAPGAANDPRVTSLRADYNEPASLVLSASAVREQVTDIDLLFIATGILHRDAGTAIAPEKSLKQLDSAAMAEVMRINAMGPMLAVQAFAPLLGKGRNVVVAALSARVGSITDNRLGGWYAYRASKAALNMLLRTAAIEIARSHPDAACIGLHPGTVESRLSAPFQRGVSAQGLFSPARSAEYLRQVLMRVEASDTGHVFAWDGSEIPA